MHYFLRFESLQTGIEGSDKNSQRDRARASIIPEENSILEWNDLEICSTKWNSWKIPDEMETGILTVYIT